MPLGKLAKQAWETYGPYSDSKNTLYQNWKLLNHLPQGKQLFSHVVGLIVPYSGTISPIVKELSPGHARVEMNDQRKVRNHLDSIHAIALANLCEFTGNLALYTGTPPDGRFIVKGLEFEFLKKARGTVSATADTPNLQTSEEREFELDVEVEDRDGDVTTRATVNTLVGPKDS